MEQLMRAVIQVSIGRCLSFGYLLRYCQSHIDYPIVYSVLKTGPVVEPDKLYIK